MKSAENRNLVFDRIESVKELKLAKDFILEEYDLQVDVEISVTGSFKRKAGEYNPANEEIRISRYLLENHPEKVFRTLKHELTHAEVFGRNQSSKPHGEEWKSMMRNLGIEDPEACHNLKLTDYNYLIKCSNPDCGMKLGRYRKSKIVKETQLYRCKDCGSKLISIER